MAIGPVGGSGSSSPSNRGREPGFFASLAGRIKRVVAPLFANSAEITSATNRSILKESVQPRSEINSFDHITRYLPNKKALLKQTESRKKEIAVLCHDLNTGDWGKILQKERLNNLPLDALLAFHDNKITGEQFTTLMTYWSAFSQLPPDEIVIKPIFGEDGEVDPDVKEWIEETVGLELGEKSTLHAQLETFFNKMKDKPKSEQSFLFIATDSYLDAKARLDGERAEKEAQVTSKSIQELLSNTEDTVCTAITKGAGFNVLHEFVHSRAFYRMIPSLGMMQTMLEAQGNKTTVIITPVIGLSTVEDIRENGLKGTREMALPFPGVELPITADFFSAPLDIDFIYHDFYHSMVANAVPDEWRKKFVDVADAIVELRQEEQDDEVGKFLEELYERMIDMEHAFFRSTSKERSLPDEEKFYSSIIREELFACMRMYSRNIYKEGTIPTYRSEWKQQILEKYKKIQESRVMEKLLTRFGGQQFLAKFDFAKLLNDNF